MKASQARSFLFSDRKILTSSVRVGVCHALRFDFPVDSSSLRHQAIAAFVQPPQRPRNACCLPHRSFHAGQIGCLRRTLGEQQFVA
ncbi:hypothetical protein [Cupriavidus alkaliphilus]|uniref:hypothetical protein n=1 Tax=Cupriavidus alkaliphilus TaxID=942866 RepID=UPI000DD79DB9|nr:hypothetical protein [Cupriavidus alkaliphilus]